MKFREKIEGCEIAARLPESAIGTLERYVENRIPCGSFTTAMLMNDAMEAAGRADIHNQRLFWEYFYVFYNHLPRGSYGSEQAVTDWLRGDANG